MIVDKILWKMKDARGPLERLLCLPASSHGDASGTPPPAVKPGTLSVCHGEAAGGGGAAAASSPDFEGPRRNLTKILDEAAAGGSLHAHGRLLVEAGDEIADIRLEYTKLKLENAKLRLQNQELKSLRAPQGSAADAVKAHLRSTLELLIAPCQYILHAVPMIELRRLLAWRCKCTEELAQVAMTELFGKENKKQQQQRPHQGSCHFARKQRMVYVFCFPGKAGKHAVALSPLGVELSKSMGNSTRPILRNVRLKSKTTPAPAPTIAEVGEKLQAIRSAEEVGYAFGFSDDDSNPGRLDQPAIKPTCVVDNSHPKQPLVWWKCACSSGLDLREQPDVHSAPVPGAFISHGDCFLVSHEHQGAYGVLYLKLHKSGLPWEAAPSALSPPPLWAYDRLPNAQEPMAVRYLQL